MTWRDAPTGSRNSVSGSDWIWFPTRLAIYLRDGRRCLACRARRVLSLDHVRPRARGGSNRPDNLITLCTRCNTERGARPIRAWRPELVPAVRAQLRAPLDRAKARALAEDLRPQRFLAHRERYRRGPLVVDGVPF